MICKLRICQNDWQKPTQDLKITYPFPESELDNNCRQKHKCAFGANADNESPDQPAHLHRLIMTFAVRLHNIYILKNVKVKNKGPGKQVI